MEFIKDQLREQKKLLITEQQNHALTKEEFQSKLYIPGIVQIYLLISQQHSNDFLTFLIQRRERYFNIASLE